MKKYAFIMLVILSSGQVQAQDSGTPVNTGYIVGGIVALLVIIYLIYTLIRPDKF